MNNCNGSHREFMYVTKASPLEMFPAELRHEANPKSGITRSHRGIYTTAVPTYPQRGSRPENTEEISRFLPRSSFSSRGVFSPWGNHPRETGKAFGVRTAKTEDDQLSFEVFRSRLTSRARTLSGLSDCPLDRWRLRGKEEVEEARTRQAGRQASGWIHLPASGIVSRERARKCGTREYCPVKWLSTQHIYRSIVRGLRPFANAAGVDVAKMNDPPFFKKDPQLGPWVYREDLKYYLPGETYILKLVLVAGKLHAKMSFHVM
ncbi:hypothetical protein ALC62_00493 [Cyphomyrmex costatus]|uniref:Uncharacterized protein n=1 Tax=Cyphomyrmex costatus TaxID=456900 RepID=A0A195D7S7_9HYME|nr:hypothetical protein ALC62_00493 [Cyphomyrmex costatus]